MDENRVAEWPFRVFVLSALLLFFTIPLRALILWINIGDIRVFGVFVVGHIGLVLGGIVGGIAWALLGRLLLWRRALLGVLVLTLVTLSGVRMIEAVMNWLLFSDFFCNLTTDVGLVAWVMLALFTRVERGAPPSGIVARLMVAAAAIILLQSMLFLVMSVLLIVVTGDWWGWLLSSMVLGGWQVVVGLGTTIALVWLGKNRASIAAAAALLVVAWVISTLLGVVPHYENVVVSWLWTAVWTTARGVFLGSLAGLLTLQAWPTLWPSGATELDDEGAGRGDDPVPAHPNAHRDAESLQSTLPATLPR